MISVTRFQTVSKDWRSLIRSRGFGERYASYHNNKNPKLLCVCDDFGVRSRIQAVVLPSEPTEFRDEVRRIFQELDRSSTEGELLTGECAPPLDVFETDEAVEIAMDLPGVAAAAVRVVARGQTILIAGHKTPRRTHLACIIVRCRRLPAICRSTAVGSAGSRQPPWVPASTWSDSTDHPLLRQGGRDQV